MVFSSLIASAAIFCVIFDAGIAAFTIKRMKIGIQTWGSNGDIRPMLALAEGLTKAGHRVTLVVSRIDNQGYRGICDHMGIDYRQVPENIDFDMQDFAQRSFSMHPLQWLRALLDEAFFPSEQVIYEVA